MSCGLSILYSGMLKCDAMYENLVAEDQSFSEVFWEHCTLEVEAGFFPRNVGSIYVIGGVKLQRP